MLLYAIYSLFSVFFLIGKNKFKLIEYCSTCTGVMGNCKRIECQVGGWSESSQREKAIHNERYKCPNCSLIERREPHNTITARSIYIHQ